MVGQKISPEIGKAVEDDFVSFQLWPGWIES